MTREEAIERISDHMEVHKIGEYPHIRLAVALNMALDALRAQQTPAKLDRSRWKGCWSCNNPKVRALGLRHGREYCPGCGKPLTEGAWAELERRINSGTTDL